MKRFIEKIYYNELICRHQTDINLNLLSTVYPDLNRHGAVTWLAHNKTKSSFRLVLDLRSSFNCPAFPQRFRVCAVY